MKVFALFLAAFVMAAFATEAWQKKNRRVFPGTTWKLVVASWGTAAVMLFLLGVAELGWVFWLSLLS